ncbi:hotdog family protein [Pseudoalteromonas obscura]|uniref:Hotdog family protein n=1 Tax=Pseudoalteromonas obscura TaxID=3048491 RepID=A0ABT7ETX8_9GAMM|nr:hotdog family protein [Pseudoalteromonas sp. P94(2023)]MDK2598502.1 hotdog family protein [Pseudoalteromonas sp. P94(2023)]
MKKNSYGIEQLIAHRDPMILITELTAYDDNHAQGTVCVTAESPFMSEKGVPSYVGIEYMAQMVAAYAGAKALDNGGTIDIGFLLGSRKYKTHTPYFKAAQNLVVSVEELHKEESGLGVFDCKIKYNDELLAEAKVNVFQPDDPQGFIKGQ